MKKITLLSLLLVSFFSFGQQDLIITGVFDGSLTGGTPKAIEIFVTADIADLSIYGIGSANNGGGTDGVEFQFTGSANAGDFIYIASEQAQFNAFFGFDPTFTSSSASINGDDAIELFGSVTDNGGLTGTVIDVFGDINVDGNGQPWEYLDGWAYRTSNTGPDGSTFTIGNWTFSGINENDDDTTQAAATNPFPIGTFGYTLSINEFQSETSPSLNVYSNISNRGVINLLTQDGSEIADLYVHNILGTLIHSEKLHHSEVRLENLTSGIYFVSAQLAGNIQTKKVFVY